jgi:hypothetical protein
VNDVDNTEPTPEMGPAMRALPPRWREAVTALFATSGDRTKALRLCGYKADNKKSLYVQACRLFADDRVRAAIREEAAKQIDIAEPEMLGTTLGILRDRAEKASDRLRAVSMIWDRSNPVISKHKLEVEHHITDAERDVRHWHALKKIGAPPEAFLARFGPNGLPRVEALVLAEEAQRRGINGHAEANTIEADYEEIAAKAEGQITASDAASFDEELL